MRRRLEYLASKKGMRTCFFTIGWFQRRGTGAWRSGVTLNPPRGYPHRCHRWRCHLRCSGRRYPAAGCCPAGGRLHALAVIAGIGGGAALGGALGIAFGVAHSLVVARCADQVGGGSPQAFTRLGVGINGSVGSAYRCGIQVKVGQVATFRLMASSTSTMVT